jgi:putative phosphoribosyl transferase
METVPDASLTLKDRTDAGRRLAEKLDRFRSEKPVVVAAHRGGTPVAFEVARILSAPLDIVVVREVTSPDARGKVVGAVAEGNLRVLDRAEIDDSGHSAADFATEFERLAREVDRAGLTYREGRAPLDVRDRTVILVADGIAHACAMRAAIGVARARGARRLIVAVGVCSRPTTQEIRRECDEIFVIRQPEFFLSVGEWYRESPSLSEDEVVGLFRVANAKFTVSQPIDSASTHGPASPDPGTS